MGGAQSAQREDKEESGGAEDAQPEQRAGDESLKNNGQISEMSGKADATVAEVTLHGEGEAAAEGEDEDEAEKPLKEIKELKKDDSPNKADANEVTLETIDMDAKHNNINDGFRRFFSNINLKVTVKRGSAEKDDIVPDVSDDTTQETPPGPERLDDTAKDNRSDNAEMNMALNTAQEPQDPDSTCPTLTDTKSEDVLEEKTTESKEDDEGSTAPAPVGDDKGVHQEATSEGAMVVSPVKRFFTTGIFSGLRKKKKSVDDTAEKELVDMRRVVAETREQPADVEQTRQDKEIGPGAETETVLTPREENGLKDEILYAASALTADEGKSTSTDPSPIIVTEPEIISSQEKDKVQASPLKRLLSGSSFKKSSKKQRERKSSDAKMSDSGEYVSNQLPSSADTAENQKGESPAGDEDGAWASFKKLMTPKKRVKQSSMSNEETPASGVAQESKSSEGEQTSDNSTEESKRRKDSSVSWEAVLCGSGRRKSRTRKTSDSEDEKPQEENENRKKESPLESSNEIDHPKQEGSASEGDGGSTWRSIKKLVTPKRKAKDEDLQSDGEAQDDSSFSIKKLLPGQKKRKPAEKQDYVSSDEADKEAASGDEDSETPAVVPLSEFETVDTGETHVDVESHTSTREDDELQQDLDQLTEPAPLCESQSEAKQVQDNKADVEKEASADAALNEDSDEATESKHQQLSDIPEEGIITETMVTPVAEQPARDDTIAEDLIEITSDAITAPEPVDVTMADDTEMISAVSQLSDSSKTSGNTTPVPVEYDVNEAEVLLQQVAENISRSPEVDPLCSDEISSERIVASVSCQILETFVKKQPTILEMHSRSDATAIKTGLNVKVLDDIRELAATAQTESIAEVNEAVFTEVVSEVPSKLDMAQSAVEDVHEVSITQTEASIRELESVNRSRDWVKGPSEYEAASSENLSETEETVESSLEARQEPVPSQTGMQEEETKNGDVKQDVQPLFGARDDVMQTKLQDEHRDQSCVQLVQELQPLERDTSRSEEDVTEAPESRESEEMPVGQPKDVEAEKEDEPWEDPAPDTAAAQPAAFDSDTSGIQICETQAASPENIPAAEPVTDEPFPEVHADPEKEDELQIDADKTDRDHVSDMFAALDSETLGGDVQTPHSSQTAEEVTDRCTEPLTQTGVESEKKEQAEAGHVSGDHTDPAADSQISRNQIIKQEALTSEEIEPGKDVTDEPEGQTESQNELNVDPELDTATELLVVQGGESRGSEKENIQTLERKVETITDDQNGRPESLMQANAKQEREGGPQADAAKAEQEPEGAEQAAAPSQTGTTHTPEDIKAEDEVTNEPREETQPVNEAHVDSEKSNGLQADAKPDHEQETALVSELGSSQTPDDGDADDPNAEVNAAPEKEDKLQAEDIAPGETVTEEPKEESEPVTEVKMEIEKTELQADDAKPEQVSEISRGEQTLLDEQTGTIQIPERETPLSEDIPTGETITEEPEDESKTVTEVRMEIEKTELQVDDAKAEQESERIEEQAAAPSQTGTIHTPNEEATPEDIKAEDVVTNEPREETQPVNEAHVDPEKNDDLQADTIKPEQRSEISRDEQDTLLDEQTGTIQIPERETPLSEDIPPGETVTEEREDESEPVTEVKMEIEKTELQADDAKPEQVSEISRGEQTLVDEQTISTIQIPERETPLCEDIPPGETVTEEPEDESEPVTGVKMEIEKTELQADAAKAEQESERLEEQAAAPSQTGTTHTPNEEAALEDIKAEYVVTNEPREETQPVNEAHVDPGKNDDLQADTIKPEQRSEISSSEQTLLDEQTGTIQIPERETPLSEDIPPGETVTEEPEDESEPVTEVRMEIEKTELQAEQESERLEEQAAAPSQTGTTHTPNEEATPEDIKAEDVVINEPREETQPVNEAHVDPEKSDDLQADTIKPEQRSEISRDEQDTLLDEQTGTIQIPERETPLSEDIPPEETVTEEPEDESEPVTEVRMEIEKTELQAEQESERLEEQAAAPSQTGTTHTPNEEATPEDIKAEDVATNEPREETQPVNEAHVDPEKSDDLQADTIKPEQRSEISRDEQDTLLDEQTGTIQIPERETPLSKDIPPEETVTEEREDESEPVTEVKMEIEKTELQAEQESERLEEQAAAPSQTGTTHTPNEEATPEDIKAEDVVTNEPREETQPVNEAHVDPEKNDDLQADTIKPEQRSEISRDEQDTLLDEQTGTIQIPERETPLSEDIPPGETVTEERKDESEPVTEVKMEIEKTELQADAAKAEQESERLEEQAAAPSQTGTTHTPNEEATLEDIKAEDVVTNEPREETQPVNEAHVDPEKSDDLQADTIKPEQRSEISRDEQDTLLDEQTGTIQIPERETPLSEDIPPEETVTEEPEDESEPVTEVKMEIEKTELQADAAKAEQESERLEEQAAAPSQTGTTHTPNEEATPEDIKAEDVVTNEPREETQPVNEAHVDPEKNDDLQADTIKPEQRSEISRDEQDTLLDEQTGTIQIPERETPLSEDIPTGETVTEEPEDESEPVTGVKMEIEKTELQADAAKAEQESERIEEQAAAPSQTGTTHTPNEEATPEDIKAEDVVTNEPREETQPVNEAHVDPEKNDDLQADTIKPEQRSEISSSEQTLLDEQTGTIQIPEKETPLSKDIPPEETVTEEREDESEPVTEVKMEIEKTELQANAAKPEHGQDSEVLAVSGADSDPGVRGIEIPEKASSAEMVTDEPQAHVEVEKEDELQADVAETEPFQVLETSGSGQAVELDSHIHCIQFTETEALLAENSEPETTAPDESREERQPVTEVHVEPEEKHADTEHVPVSETEEDTSSSVSHTGNVQIPEKETDPDKTETSKDRESVTDVHVEPEEKQVSDTAEGRTSKPVSHISSVQIPPLSEDFKPEEAVTDEPQEDLESEKETEQHEDEHEQHANVLAAQEAARESEMAGIQIPEHNVQLSDTTEHLRVITADDGRRPQVDASTDQASLALVTPQAPAADAEEGGVVEKGSTSEATVESQTAPEINAEAKTEPVQQPEMEKQSVLQEGSVTSTKMEVTVSEDTRGAVDKPTQAAEGNTELEEERSAGDAQESLLPCDVTIEIVEQPLLENLISPRMDPVRNEAGEEVNQDLGINKDQAAEISPHDVRAEQEESVPEVVGKLQTTSAVHVSSISEQKARAAILDKTVISGKSPAPGPDKVRDTYEAKHEVHLSEVQGLREQEKEGELPGLEIKTSSVEHAVVAQVTMCSLKEVSPATPVVLTEKPSNVREPFIEVLVSELQIKKEAEIATPLVQSAVTETATESSVVVTMHVPSAEFGDNHRIQVQVVDVDMKSAETGVDSVLEVGVTQTKDAIDVCHETIKVTEKLSATEETEEEPVKEEHTIIRHQVIHMKENLPAIEVVQTSSEDGAVNLDETRGNKSQEVDQKATEASYGSISRDETTAAQLVDMSDSPGSLNATRDHKEDLEEDRREPKKDGAGVTADEAKSPSGNKTGKTDEEAQTKPSFLSQTVTVGNTGLDVPQNTGVISSIGNLESPSSLSLEFKLNIQFGQAKTPAPQRTEPVKHSNVSEVGIQAVEPLRPINGAHENHRKPEMQDVTVQATEITEPEHVHLNATERAVIIKQPVLLDIGIQSVEAAQPVEQIRSTERLNPSALETEKIKAAMQAETFLSQPVLYEACYEEITVEEPVQQIEEENEQDLWVDAEEHIQSQEASHGSLKAEEAVARQTESDEEEKAEREHEFEMAPENAPKPEMEEDGGGQQEAQRTGEVCETDKEVEEFAAALEHPDAAKAAAAD